MNKTTIL